MKVNVLRDYLVQLKYDERKTQFLVDGFTNGFSIGYQCTRPVKQLSPNLKLCIGNEIVLWNKVMKEVKLKRYAGPFEKLPFDDDYIQSPIGLVPKDGGKKCHLIFHLSYPRNSG